MGLDNLKELDDFQEFKKFIKKFIIDSDDLFRLIYFPMSNPFSSECETMTPYDIFEASSEHGCVLFRRKNDIVLSEESVNVLVNFHSAKVNDIFDDLFITFHVICKGVNIQELENGVNRCSAIANEIDNRFSKAVINDISKISRLSYKDISLNEENSGMLITFNCRVFANHLLDNVNYLKKQYGVDNREYL